MNLYRCIAFCFVSMKPSTSERRSSLFYGFLSPAALQKNLFASNGLSALPGQLKEIEDYTVSLEAVSALELTIQPDLGRDEAIATLAV